MEPHARRRSIHVDAPVEKVFDHVKGPANFVAADPEAVQLSNLSLTPEEVGSTWESSWRAFGRRLHDLGLTETGVGSEPLRTNAKSHLGWPRPRVPSRTNWMSRGRRANRMSSASQETRVNSGTP